MRKYTLDAKTFNGVESFYDTLTKVFALPDYFGRNLDAVYDCLSQINDEIELTWLDHKKSKDELSKDTTHAGFYGALMRTLKDIPNLHLTLK